MCDWLQLEEMDTHMNSDGGELVGVIHYTTVPACGETYGKLFMTSHMVYI